MLPLTPDDHALIAHARDAIRRNYDGVRENHTVGAAVRCADGSIFCGVNVYAIHGACAEQVALGTAITEGQRDFTTIVAVRGRKRRRDHPALRQLPPDPLRLRTGLRRHYRRRRHARENTCA